jgi:hypothetical protein
MCTSPFKEVNDEHAMMRFEFIEVMVRIATAKYGKGWAPEGGKALSLPGALQHLFQTNVLPRYGLARIARHVIGCRLTQLTRVEHALDDCHVSLADIARPIIGCHVTRDTRVQNAS